MNIDTESPENQSVLRYLRQVKGADAPESASPESLPNVYLATKTHPEVGARLWEDLGGMLPADCRWIVCGAPALVHPRTGTLFGVALGTQYCLRLEPEGLEQARADGARTAIRWTDGQELDLERELGAGWVFGGYRDGEADWCSAAFRALEVAP